jgi:tRNA-dihydrouridine synthase
MGTAAIEDQNMVWDLCRDHADKIVVSLDVRPDEEIATRGWTYNSGRYLEEVLIEMSSAGVAAILIAEAGRDALAEPPDLRVLAEALAIVEQPVIAAGGVRHLDDLRALLALQASGRRLGGVVVGREVTAGRFSLDEAKEVIATHAVAELDIEAEPDIQPEPAGVVLTIETDFLEIAEQLERAAAHARTAVSNLKGGDMHAGMSQGFAVSGHLHAARRLLDHIAEHHLGIVGRRS